MVAAPLRFWLHTGHSCVRQRRSNGASSAAKWKANKTVSLFCRAVNSAPARGDDGVSLSWNRAAGRGRGGTPDIAIERRLRFPMPHEVLMAGRAAVRNVTSEHCRLVITVHPLAPLARSNGATGDYWREAARIVSTQVWIARKLSRSH